MAPMMPYPAKVYHMLSAIHLLNDNQRGRESGPLPNPQDEIGIDCIYCYTYTVVCTVFCSFNRLVNPIKSGIGI